MPTYQYACTDPDCGNRFELVQAFTDPAATTCPVCSSRVRKVYGSVGVVFKGSGFYRNDSRNEGSKSSSGEPARASKDSKESGSKESSAKESGSKDSGSSGSASSAASTTSSSSSSGSGSSSGSSSGSGSSGKAAASA